MKRAKRLARRIFCLPPLPTALVAVPSFVLVGWVLARGENGPLAYAAYLASSYALAISLTSLPRMARCLGGWVRHRKAVQWLLARPLAQRLLGDEALRTKLLLRQGLAVNLLYAALKLGAGVCYRSVWFASLGGYYLLLAAMRFLLLRGQNGDDAAAEWRRCHVCGWCLLAMNLALAGMVFFVVHRNESYRYPGLLIYAMAAYSFYAVITAAIGVFHARADKSPVRAAARVVSLVAAMVSIFSLETALLARFGADEGPRFRQMMTSATGAGLCVMVLGLAVWMIARAAKALRGQKAPKR